MPRLCPLPATVLRGPRCARALVRVLCPHCKVPTIIDPEILVNEGIDPTLFENREVYRAEGCSKCQKTGFHDCIGIYEMILVGSDVRMMIIEKRDAAYIRDRCVEMGMRTMLDDGIEKVLNGVTTLEEVVRVIRE